MFEPQNDNHNPTYLFDHLSGKGPFTINKKRAAQLPEPRPTQPLNRTETERRPRPYSSNSSGAPPTNTDEGLRVFHGRRDSNEPEACLKCRVFIPFSTLRGA